MICWNVRGLNKSARYLEVGVHLKKMQVSCLVLLETRVKIGNSESIRKKLGLNWSYSDNYEYHVNGRIWLGWDPNVWSIIPSEATDQLIHSSVYTKEGVFFHHLTTVYAHNQLNNRRTLWHDINRISAQLQGPWMVVGDLNNILRVGDRVGGNDIHLAEYIDMEDMMHTSNLSEHETSGAWFTWTNKQEANPISSRIDRALVNADWHRRFLNSSVEVLNPHISDHSPLRIKLDSSQQVRKIKHRFKFLNCAADNVDFINVLRANWIPLAQGNPMEQFWKRLYRLQYCMKGLNWHITEGLRNLKMSRDKLDQAQTLLASDQMNKDMCNSVKHWTEEVMKGAELEEKILHQKLKCDWINLGDGNNAYFYANLKSKNKHVHIQDLEDSNGNKLTEQKDIEREVLSFYSKLIGQAATQRKQVDICSLRIG
ncbi:uncharacterized protein LOC131645245 [Vicia villosa]|uniref:uncharacterized protein LOC131645245 n=1 Tax=Vicia villosa TaxID=3911 RepID=UPI00273ADCC9|nr:uncharacterized protein LOC131645245 [Vicia villosa]